MIYFVLFIICISIGIILRCVVVKKENEEKEKNLNEKKKLYDEYSKKYDLLFEKYKDNKYYHFGEMTHHAIIDNHLYRLGSKNKLELLEYMKIEDLKKDVIEIITDMDDIKYYKLEGSVQQQQHITGGGGGGSSVKGAIVGGLIAGTAGAIVGSRNKDDEIKTSYTTFDDRSVVIELNNGSHFWVDYRFYDKLLDYIPEKDYDNYIANKKEKGKK